MAEYIEREALDQLIESRKVRGDCKFCAKYERCIANGINRKGSHLYCWEQLKLPTADVVPVVRCKDCKHCDHFYPERDVNGNHREAYYCKSIKGDVNPTDYCCWGERRCSDD